jgi:anti-anti-sigma factor
VCGGHDVDSLTSPTLGAVLGALVDQAHPSLVLDLSALAFIDAAGLGVIADVSARLATSDRVLTVRATPAHARRVFDITGVGALVQFEAPLPAVAALGAEQRSDDHSVAVVTEPADISADLARVGAKPNDAVIDTALRLVTALAGSTVDGADRVSVTLA